MCRNSVLSEKSVEGEGVVNLGVEGEGVETDVLDACRYVRR